MKGLKGGLEYFQIVTKFFKVEHIDCSRNLMQTEEFVNSIPDGH